MEIGAQLVSLIRDAFKVSAVAIWVAREPRMNTAGSEVVPEDEVRAAYFNNASDLDLIPGQVKRVFRVGIRPVGALSISASHDNYLDSKSVDALASLAALTLERANSFIAESKAEAARRSEQLRSAILDGLAHAIKTPLTTIQTLAGAHRAIT